MKKYVITIEFEANEIPEDVMDELTSMCAVQVESLTDGSIIRLVSDEDVSVRYPYEKVESNWKKGE